MSTITPLDKSSILAAADRLPAAPRIMARLYRLLLDYNSGLRGICDLLKTDPALSLRVIRIANSPAYGAAGVGTLEEALGRVGFGEVYRLVGIASNESLAAEGLRCYGFAAEAFQRHNLLSALIAERLALVVNADAPSAYTAGLLRRVGQLLLDQVGRSRLDAAHYFTATGAGRAADWETETFGVNHYQVAATLLGAWGFPAEIVAAVAHGHGSDAEMSRLARVVDLTDNLVRLAGHGLTSDEAEWGVPQDKLAALGIDHDTALQVKADALNLLEMMQSPGRAAA